MTSQKAGPGAQEMCTCDSVLDSYRYDPPTGLYVHKGCGRPRDGGPTTESVVAFIDGILEKRRIREGVER